MADERAIYRDEAVEVMFAVHDILAVRRAIRRLLEGSDEEEPDE